MCEMSEQPREHNKSSEESEETGEESSDASASEDSNSSSRVSEHKESDMHEKPASQKRVRRPERWKNAKRKHRRTTGKRCLSKRSFDGFWNSVCRTPFSVAVVRL